MRRGALHERGHEAGQLDSRGRIRQGPMRSELERIYGHAARAREPGTRPDILVCPKNGPVQ